MPITQEILDSAYTWNSYMQLFEQLVAEGKTTGPNQSEAMVEYTKLNLTRSQRVTKQLKLTPSLELALKEIQEDWVLLALTETWCGDTAQILPLVAAIADYCPRIDFRLILRDEHPTIMDNYETNGGRAIPIVICLQKDTLAEKGYWGPRPAPAQQMILDHKANPIKTQTEVYADLHHWYSKDKTATTQVEFVEKIREWLG